MKVLSILQPWASLCVTTDPNTGKAYKQVETRSWNTKFRGPLLIHASKRGMLGWMKDLVNKWIFPNNPKLQFTLGAIIGMVNLVDTFETIPAKAINFFLESDGKQWVLTEEEYAFGDYTVGRYGWLLSDPVLFKNPIPCKGSLSIWNLPDELEGAVIAEFHNSSIAIPGEGAVIVEATATKRDNMTKENKLEMQTAYNYCVSEEKSAEFTIQYLMDSSRCSFDEAIEFIKSK